MLCYSIAAPWWTSHDNLPRRCWLEFASSWIGLELLAGLARAETWGIPTLVRDWPLYSPVHHNKSGFRQLWNGSYPCLSGVCWHILPPSLVEASPGGAFDWISRTVILCFIHAGSGGHSRGRLGWTNAQQPAGSALR